jgi:hypothetical protein
VLDLFSSLHIDGNGATTNPGGQAASSLPRRGGIVRQLAHLHVSSKNHELRKVDALTGQASAQIVKRLANKWRLGDRVTRMRCRHQASVAPCSTVSSEPGRHGYARYGRPCSG